MDLATIGHGLDFARYLNTSGLPEGSGEIITAALLVAGIFAILQLMAIHKNTKGLISNIDKAKKTGRTLSLIPVDGGTFDNDLMPEKLDDGTYKYKKWGWGITEQGKGLLLPGVEYTVCIPNIGTNMTIPQMATMIQKGTYVLSHYPNKDDLQKNPQLFEEILRQLHQATYIPSAAAVESQIMKSANMQLPMLIANKEKEIKMIFWIIVLLIVVIGGYYLITSKPPTSVTCLYETAKVTATTLAANIPPTGGVV